MNPVWWCTIGVAVGLLIAAIIYVVIISGLYDFFRGNW